MANKILVTLFIIALPCSTFAATIASDQQDLEFHGYIRESLGTSEQGSTQARFQAPGARGKYRLGNEPDTNIELQVDYTYSLKNPENKSANIQGIFMLDGYKNQGESNEFTLGHLAQAYLSFNGLFDDEMKIWLGRRYYDRKSVHIMNHFWLNPGQNSQAAVGFEDLSTGSGKLNLALFRSEDDFTLAGTSYLINNTVIDGRWHNLAISESSVLTLWAKLASRTELEELGYESKTGYGLGFWLDSKSSSTKNTLAVLYQTGAAITQSDFNPNAVREDLGWNLDAATTIEINNTITYETLPDYSFQAVVLFRQEDYGQDENSNIRWYSTGIRPVFYFSKHINLALEAGIDYIDDEVNNRKGSLKKFTTALQISANRGFKSRPVLRFFVTVAEWSEDFKGLVGNGPGNAPYGDDTQGWSLGAQAEVWW